MSSKQFGRYIDPRRLILMKVLRENVCGGSAAYLGDMSSYFIKTLATAGSADHSYIEAREVSCRLAGENGAG